MFKNYTTAIHRSSIATIVLAVALLAFSVVSAASPQLTDPCADDPFRFAEICLTQLSSAQSRDAARLSTLAEFYASSDSLPSLNQGQIAEATRW